MPKRRFELREGKSNKFWEVELEGTSHTVQYGRIGTTGRTQTKEFDLKEQAKSSYEKLIEQKLKKGYVEVPQQVDCSATKSSSEPSRVGKRRTSTKVAVRKAWGRIEKWFLSHDPDDVETLSEPPHLAPGASEEQIAATEEILGLTFPDDLRTSYILHDGSHDVWILERGILLSLEKIADDWSMYRDFCDPNSESFVPGWNSELIASDKERAPEAVKKVHWNPGWIPVAENGGGDHVCVDTDPDECGVIGQVFFRSHEVGPTLVLANSFLELLETYANDLERGRIVFNEWGDFERTG